MGKKFRWLLMSLFLGCVLLRGGPALPAEETNPEVEKFVRLSQTDNDVIAVIWMPEGFWELAAHQMGPDMTEDAEAGLAMMQDMTKSYLMFGVISLRRSYSGDVVAQSEKDVLSQIRLVDRYGKKVKPLQGKKLGGDISLFLGFMKTSLMQNKEFGEYIRLVVFENADTRGYKVVSNTLPGVLTVEMRGQKFFWEYPIRVGEGASRPDPSRAQHSKVDQDNEEQFNRALDLVDQGKWDEAIEVLEKLAAKVKSSAAVYFLMGICYSGKEMDKKAIEYYKRALVAEPSDELQSKIHTRIGESYLIMEKYQDAKDALKSALKANPDNNAAHYFLGKAYVALGDTDAALEVMNYLYDKDQEEYAEKLKAAIQKKLSR